LDLAAAKDAEAPTVSTTKEVVDALKEVVQSPETPIVAVAAAAGAAAVVAVSS